MDTLRKFRTDASLVKRAHVVDMGTGKKEASLKARQSRAGDGLNNVKVKGENFFR